MMYKKLLTILLLAIAFFLNLSVRDRTDNETNVNPKNKLREQINSDQENYERIDPSEKSIEQIVLRLFDELIVDFSNNLH